MFLSFAGLHQGGLKLSICWCSISCWDSRRIIMENVSAIIKGFVFWHVRKFGKSCLKEWCNNYFWDQCLEKLWKDLQIILESNVYFNKWVNYHKAKLAFFQIWFAVYSYTYEETNEVNHMFYWLAMWQVKGIIYYGEQYVKGLLKEITYHSGEQCLSGHERNFSHHTIGF